MFGSQWFADSDSGDIPVTTNLFAHFRADLGITKDGSDLVSGWADQSGNSNDLAQSTATNKPTWKSANFNGQDSLDFDGTDNFIYKASISQAAPYHCFIAFLQDSWTDNDIILSVRDGADLEIVQHAGSTPEVNIRNGESFVCTVSPTLDTRYLLQASFNGSSGFLALNNDSAVTGDTSSDALNSIILGSKSSGGTQYADMSVAELAIYSSVQAGAALASLKSYFNTRYDLY